MPGTREAQAAADGGGHYVILSQSGNNKHLKQTITELATLSAKTINISTELSQHHNVTVHETLKHFLERPDALSPVHPLLDSSETEWRRGKGVRRCGGEREGRHA